MPSSARPSPPSLFPTYLIPSLSFRRRKSSSDSKSSSASTETAATVSPTRANFLEGHASHLQCARCLADLALSEQIISKGFTGRHGRAYLISPSTSAMASNPLSSGSAIARNDALPNLPNTYTHKPAPRQLVTGAHTVSDISCAQCGSVLGWKYVAAEEEAQRYKVGKFILETKRVCRSSYWEDEEGRTGMVGARPPAIHSLAEEQVEFDSQDEDECEDLFLGAWTPQSAARRRRMKKFEKSDG